MGHLEILRPLLPSAHTPLAMRVSASPKGLHRICWIQQGSVLVIGHVLPATSIFQRDQLHHHSGTVTGQVNELGICRSMNTPYILKSGPHHPVEVSCENEMLHTRSKPLPISLVIDTAWINDKKRIMYSIASQSCTSRWKNQQREATFQA